MNSMQPKTPSDRDPAIHPDQSMELLQSLHLVTRDSKLNQDSRRKLKQIYHLYQFFLPLLQNLKEKKTFSIVDHGSGKSYLGFILYDLFLKKIQSDIDFSFCFYNIESREELIKKSIELSRNMNFLKMKFLSSTIKDSITSSEIETEVDLVCALHACDTATDDAIDFALAKNSKYLVLIPCCQAEVSRNLTANKNHFKNFSRYEIWRHPIHTREFGSHLTNVLRCLRLEAEGYKVTVTEFTGLEHSLKNELIIAEKIEKPRQRFKKKIEEILTEYGLLDLKNRFGA